MKPQEPAASEAALLHDRCLFPPSAPANKKPGVHPVTLLPEVKGEAKEGLGLGS